MTSGWVITPEKGRVARVLDQMSERSVQWKLKLGRLRDAAFDIDGQPMKLPAWASDAIDAYTRG